MTVTAVYDINKKKVGEMDLPDSIFAVPIKMDLIHQAVCVHLSNKRQGTVRTKTRADVRGGGRKPYKQKGTGNARHGSIRSPIFVGGGAAFGPKPRDWTIELPKKQRSAALKMALSLKHKEGSIFILDGFTCKSGKTKDMVKSLKNWETKSGMIVTDINDENTRRSIRNIPNIKMVPETNVTVYDIIKFNSLMMTKGAVEKIIKKFEN